MTLTRPLATLLAWSERMADHDDDRAARPLWRSIAQQVRDYGDDPEPPAQDEALFEEMP